MSTVIETRNLTKSFGRTRALDGLDLTVEQGEVHGFLGPNGAGKTTTIRVLLGLLKADSGTARLLGGDSWTDIESIHRRIAYVPGDVTLWPNLTGGEVIDLLGRLRGDLDKDRRAELLERFDLDPTKRCRSYSKGNRQKVALVAALASRAEVFLLDEPTAGLDPLMEAAFAEVARGLAQRGATILLSSHILSEVEKLSDRISIIRAGRIVEVGTLAEMRRLHTTTITASVRGPVPTLDTIPGVTDLVREGSMVRFSVDGDHLDAAVTAVAAAGVDSLVSEPPSLEQLFLSKYETSTAPAERLVHDGGVR
ncbi:MAG TPA: ABC transporter ATP-binding protein [Propionibacteriaceae bacterium]|nr:ABC transporter ATP-binding protein [Propionibacteriaceae bacterium]